MLIALLGEVWTIAPSLQRTLLIQSLIQSSRPILSKQIINSIWHNYTPPRAQLTLWLANLEKLKTGDILLQQGIIDPQQALCPFCSLEVESNPHILFTCQFSWGIWMNMLEWWGIQGVFQNRCESFIMAWNGMMKFRGNKKLWRMICGCVIWTLWYERNKENLSRTRRTSIDLFTAWESGSAPGQRSCWVSYTYHQISSFITLMLLSCNPNPDVLVWSKVFLVLLGLV